MSESTSAEDDLKFNSSDFVRMIYLSNFLCDKFTPKSFRSKMDIAKRFESFVNADGISVSIPSKTSLNLIDRMMYAGFIQINDDNEYFFDEDKFDKFVHKEHPDGVEFWKYIDRLVDYIE